MNSVKKITRRELFKEMTSKETVKEVMKAWYSFTNPLMESKPAPPPKKESLLEKVQRLNMKYSRQTINTENVVNPNRKEG